MRICSLIKMAIDVTNLRIDEKEHKPLIEEVSLKISDIDKNAIEEAVRIKEKLGGEALGLSVLNWHPLDRRKNEAISEARKALAMGLDEFYLVIDERLLGCDPLVTSRVLAKAIKNLGPFDLIIAAEGTIDNFSSQVGPRLSNELKLPLIPYVRYLTIRGTTLEAECSFEEGSIIIRSNIPAIITVTREINEPRIPKLRDILAAKRKKLKVLSLKDLNDVDIKTKLKVVDIYSLSFRRRGKQLSGKNVEEIVTKLVEILENMEVI